MLLGFNSNNIYIYIYIYVYIYVCVCVCVYTHTQGMLGNIGNYKQMIIIIKVAWNHIIVYQLLVLDRNICYYITVQKNGC